MDKTHLGKQSQLDFWLIFLQLPYYAYINGTLTIGIIACLIYLTYKTSIKHLQWSYTLIISGAIGNAKIDSSSAM